MIFRDNITLVAPVDGVYRQTGGERHSVKCVIEQTSGLTRGGSYDAMTSGRTGQLVVINWLLDRGIFCRGDVVWR